MKSEVIVDVQPAEVQIALLEEGKLVEFQREGRTEHFAVGNIYLAPVRKIMPGLNACFVNVGHERDAFLHYLDLGAHYHAMEKYIATASARPSCVPRIGTIPNQADTGKDGSIQNVLKQGDMLLVQIVKEPISTKGPRLTCELSFAGRYLVLMPFSEKINVSTKIKKDKERARLKRIIHSAKPSGFGVIIRTVAEDAAAEELTEELNSLIAQWEDTVRRMQQRLKAATPDANKGNAKKSPALVYEETSRAVGMLRDLLNPSYENIYVNDPNICDELKSYVTLIAPDRKDIVKHYKGTVPIFDNFSVTKQIKTSLGRIVSYKHGAYLIIEQTEALHVVDVNSGTRSKSAEGQEINALDVNLGAADEIARQLRLRDIGGIIVVDFIDMAEAEHRQALYERMVENMKRDRAKHNILPLSKFGLMQITRQRVRPATNVTVEEACPTCGGTGSIKSSLLFTDALESKINTLVHTIGIRKFRLHVHPFVAAYLRRGLFPIAWRWKLKFSPRISIVASQKLAYLEYHFYDSNGEEIELQETGDMH